LKDNIVTRCSDLERRYKSKIEFERELKAMIDFLAFHPLIAFEQLIINLSKRLIAIIYTQLSDVENESNGIFTYNRESIKFFIVYLKIIFLVYISVPYTNYTKVSLSKSFNLVIANNSKKFLSILFFS